MVQTSVIREIRWLVEWKVNDIDEQMRDKDYYDQNPEELEGLKEEVERLGKGLQFLSEMLGGVKDEE